MDVERRGDGVDEPDLFDSLSARARRRANNRQPHRYRGKSKMCFSEYTSTFVGTKNSLIN